MLAVVEDQNSMVFTLNATNGQCLNPKLVIEAIVGNYAKDQIDCDFEVMKTGFSVVEK